jgi:hypothetical protein
MGLPRADAVPFVLVVGVLILLYEGVIGVAAALLAFEGLGRLTRYKRS